MSTQQIGEVKGLRELKEKLRGLGPDLEKKALRKGAVAAARLILREAKARFRSQFTSRTGTGEKSLSLSVGRRKGGGVFARIGVRSDGFYLAFLEKGWHAVGRAKRSALGAERRGLPSRPGFKGRRGRGAGRDRGPGRKIPGRPFMSPAVDSKAEEALREFERAISEWVDGLPGK